MSEKISVYIVEDYLLSRMNLVCILADKYNILGNFGRAENCLDAMVTQKADIVIMDLGLPLMNGIEATRLIKQKYPDTKVVVFTSYENEDVVKAAVSCGANAYCTKEIDTKCFLNVLDLIKDGALWLDPKIASFAKHMVAQPISTDFGNLYPSRNRHSLTERELSVLKLVTKGRTNPQIAEELCISSNTVKAHVTHIMKKLCVVNRSEVIVKAIKESLIED